MLEEEVGEGGVVVEVGGGAQGARGHGVHLGGSQGRDWLSIKEGNSEILNQAVYNTIDIAEDVKERLKLGPPGCSYFCKRLPRSTGNFRRMGPWC